MKKRNLILSILLIIILVIVIGIESCLYLNVDLKKIFSSFNPIKDQKYLVDITTSFNKNPLQYEVHNKDNNIYYISIKGLKNKNVEDKINNKIKNIVDKLASNNNLGTKKIYTTKYLGFENTLSLEFRLVDNVIEDYETIDNVYDGIVLDTLNVNLNDGEELSLLDVINDKEVVKEQLLKRIEDRLYLDLGMVYNTCLDCKIDKDYEKVEENLLSIMNHFNSDDYLFSYRDSVINFFFNDVYVYSPIMYSEYDEEYKTSKNDSDCTLIKDKYESFYYCKKYTNYYEANVEFLDLIDNLIIYDKYKNPNIFIDKPIKVNRKFSEFDTYSSLSDCSYNYCAYFTEENNNIYDFIVSYYTDDSKGFIESLKNNFQKQNNSYNVYKVNCTNEMPFLPLEYEYFSCYTYVYNLGKDKYNKYRHDIYFNSYDYEAYFNILNNGEENTYKFIPSNLGKISYDYKIVNSSDQIMDLGVIVSNNIYKYIPDSFLEEGISKEDLVNNMEIYLDDSVIDQNKLCLYIDEIKGEISLRYKDKIEVLDKVNEDNYEEYYKKAMELMQDIFD